MTVTVTVECGHMYQPKIKNEQPLFSSFQEQNLPEYSLGFSERTGGWGMFTD